MEALANVRLHVILMYVWHLFNNGSLIMSPWGRCFLKEKGRKKYSKELKIQAVEDYLAGSGSQTDICKKYGIRSKGKLQRWIMQYNGHEELKSSGTGGSTIMTRGRKTTFDERVEIV